MRMIFCQNLLDSRQVDLMYQPEANTARMLAIPYALINFEDLIAGSVQAAIRRVPVSDQVERAIYRG